MNPRTSHPGRVRRGLKANLCAGCDGGVVPGRPKTFDPGCAGCLEKKARYDRIQQCPCRSAGEGDLCEQCLLDKSLGLRTGKEPPPKKYAVGNYRKRNATGKTAAAARRYEIMAAARRRGYAL